MGVVKDQFVFFLKKKNCSTQEQVKTVYGGGKKQFQENREESIKNTFELKKGN